MQPITAGDRFALSVWFKRGKQPLQNMAAPANSTDNVGESDSDDCGWGRAAVPIAVVAAMAVVANVLSGFGS